LLRYCSPVLRFPGKQAAICPGEAFHSHNLVEQACNAGDAIFELRGCAVAKVMDEPVWPTLKVEAGSFTAVTVPWTSSISPSSFLLVAGHSGALAVMLNEDAVKAIPLTTQRLL